MGIEYVFVDTCVLAGILLQYNPVAPHDKLVESPFLKQDMLKLLNKIIEDRLSDSGYVIASIFAFVELINKMKSIFGEKLSLERINSVISQPPSWLIIEPMDVQTANFFCDVPDMVDGENVSSDDAVHVATAMQRGDKLTFLTTDHILKKLKLDNIKFLGT